MLVLLDRDRLTNDEIWGTICISVPRSKFWGDASPPAPHDLRPCGVDKSRWGGLKFATFDKKCAVTQKQYKIDELKSNRKSYALYQIAMFTMTFDDP